jgi:hypothetical protein
MSVVDLSLPLTPETKKQKRLLAQAERDGAVFITGPMLLVRYGVSEQTIWRWRRNKALGFPNCFTIQRRNYWRLADLVKWERARAAASPSSK